MQRQEERIKEIKTALEEAKNQRYKAELRLENLQQQEKAILEELEELGVEPERLDEEIQRLEQEIDRQIEEAWSLLPQELIGNYGSEE
ncbi:hypothetical protein SAMN04488112_103171 [Melghirimyces thermohalophilus]|uniref:Uncharacterized protein n=1 Tax=Melghirimyces thermohalophilus TaxID=1236220 RepID=A0A1G6J3Y5_9BACL|nr:hypothetical protein [Melghirimyces thermohalophilus]SDC13440.1 hypothetical protein SAMN04488112_103171 [Melghirimyces thermohalophilus]